MAALAITLLAACAPASRSTAAPLAHAPDGRRIDVAFADEFDTFSRFANGAGTWRTTFRDGVGKDAFELRTLRWNKELQLYVDPEMTDAAGRGDLRLNPFETRDGALVISAQPTPGPLVERLGGFRYMSGLITTQPSFAQTYGYFEMRAKLPAGKGVWPAFWLLPQDFSWPPEIDVMESIGDPATVYVTAHSATRKAEGIEAKVSPDDFHVYAVAWDRQNLVWYVDGREIGRQPTPADMHKPMYMLANIALGGDWAGAPDGANRWPARLTIDYIRAYRFAE